MARQKMLTKKILEDTPELGYGDEMKMEEQTVTGKFFDPTGSFTWYLMELDKDEDRAYGFVTSHMVPDGDHHKYQHNNTEQYTQNTDSGWWSIVGCTEKTRVVQSMKDDCGIQSFNSLRGIPIKMGQF